MTEDKAYQSYLLRRNIRDNYSRNRTFLDKTKFTMEDLRAERSACHQEIIYLQRIMNSIDTAITKRRNEKPKPPKKPKIKNIPKHLDKRRKYSDEFKSEILRLRHIENMTMPAIAKKMGVSLYCVKQLVNPNQALKTWGKRTWKKYYDKDKHRQNMAKYRQRLRDLNK